MFSRSTRLLWLIAIMLFSSIAFAQTAHPYTEHDVDDALAQKNFSLADQELRSVIALHPTNAKAHYLLSEALFYEGQYGAAQSEIERAQALDPTIGFTDQDHFRKFQSKINHALEPTMSSPVHAAMAHSAAMGQTTRGHDSRNPSIVIIGFVIVALLVVLLILVAMYIRSQRRRRAVFHAQRLIAQYYFEQFNENRKRVMVSLREQANYSHRTDPPTGFKVQQPSSSPAPGYHPSTPAPQPQQGHSTGAVVGAGVAGLAGGLLLSEILSESQNHNHGSVGNDPVDLGNNSGGWDNNSSSTSSPDPVDYGNSSSSDSSWSSSDSSGGGSDSGGSDGW